MDVTEIEIERPKKNRSVTESGKQRYHTLKMQLIIGQENKQVICTEVGQGRQHDFQIYKNSRSPVLETVKLLADKGYQGIYHYHKNSSIPHKKPRNGQLTKEQKQQNRAQARL